ncbi:hypothetical protein HMPREF3150_01190 [Pseudomonas aeruginosa]|nr:hypothetical protein HMPREF3150_01190 [Pseudomonas aeruginosa]
MEHASAWPDRSPQPKCLPCLPLSLQAPAAQAAMAAVRALSR